MKKLLLFADEPTPRLHYAAGLFFENLLGLEIEWTGDRAVFGQSLWPKVNYSDGPVAENEVWVRPQGLLFEEGVRGHEIEVGKWRGVEVFFHGDGGLARVSPPRPPQRGGGITGEAWLDGGSPPLGGAGGANAGEDIELHLEEKEPPFPKIPFDFLAASFWLVSRYEEYLPFKKDRHGRFAATESLAFKHGFLEKPLVDLWAVEIGKILSEKFPQIQLRKRAFEFRLTYDVDYAFSYLHKGLLRNTAGLIRDFLKLDFKKVWQRTAVGLGFEKDPFDTFSYQKSISGNLALLPAYFFHVGNYTGEPDAPIGFEEPAFRNLIKELSKEHTVGLHPSYKSFNKTTIVDKEKKRLEEIVERPNTDSRQHFLLLSFPETYRLLIELSIEKDWSLGYADAVGFRASIAEDFYWFDLLKNERTELLIKPFQIMDVTLNQYLQLSIEGAIALSKKLIENTAAVGGRLTAIWHNNSLSEQGAWAGWRVVLEKMVEAAGGRER